MKNMITKMVVKAQEKKGDFVGDKAAILVITLVLAGITLAVLSNYIETDFMTMVTNKMSDLMS